MRKTLRFFRPLEDGNYQQVIGSYSTGDGLFGIGGPVTDDELGPIFRVAIEADKDRTDSIVILHNETFEFIRLVPVVEEK